MSDVTIIRDDPAEPPAGDDAVAFAAGAATVVAAEAAAQAADAQQTAEAAAETATAAATVAVETAADLAARVDELEQRANRQEIMTDALALHALAQAEELDAVEDELAPEKVEKTDETERDHEPRHGMSKTWFPG